MSGKKVWNRNKLKKMFPSLYKEDALEGKEAASFMKSIAKKK